MPDDKSKKDERISTRKRKNMMLKALEANLGIVTESCKQAGIPRSLYYHWLKEDENFKRRADDIADIAVDFVEGRLFDQIKGDSKGAVTATIFYLKTKGKARGYVERSEWAPVNPDGEPLTISDDQAIEIFEVAAQSLKDRNEPKP